MCLESWGKRIVNFTKISLKEHEGAMDTEIWIQKTPQSRNRYLLILLLQALIPFLPPLEESVWLWSTGERNAGCLGHIWRVVLCCPAGMLSQGPWADCASTKAHLAQFEPFCTGKQLVSQNSTAVPRYPQALWLWHSCCCCALRWPGRAVIPGLNSYFVVKCLLKAVQLCRFYTNSVEGGGQGGRKDFIPFHTIRSAIHYCY